MFNISKFRAWHRVKKTMFTVDVIDYRLDVIRAYEDGEYYGDEEVVLLNSSSLRDYYSKIHIYNGDIVELQFEGSLVRFEVVYEGGSFVFRSSELTIGFWGLDFKEVKPRIVGNIFENKEMLR